VILNPVFIFWFGWGVRGSALATVISMIILTIWVISHFRSSRSVVKLKLGNIRFNLKIVLEILAIGVSPFFMQIANSVVQGLINAKLIAFGGDLAVGAMGIVNSVLTLIIMSIVAINMATQPIISYNYGAGSIVRVKETLKLAIVMSTLIAIVSFAFVEMFPHQIVKLFNSSDPDLLEYGMEGLRMCFLALPLVGFQVVTGNFFQSIGKAKIAVLQTLLRQVIILIPLLFILPHLFGLHGIWLAIPISDTFAAVVVVLILIKYWKKLDQPHSGMPK
jgi:Na+-driven multidrug efflux pump